METGQTVLTILLLTTVVALGFSYSDEVSRNRRLYAQLRKGLPEPGLVARLRELYKEIEALEHAIALKDETIKNLNGDLAKLKFDYAVEVAGRRDSENKLLAPLRGEWTDLDEEVDN